MELLPLAGLGVKGGFGTGGTMVAGIGFVSGRMCLINANVGTNKGGAIDLATLKKALRINEIANENNLPAINLVESAGANLPTRRRFSILAEIILRKSPVAPKEGYLPFLLYSAIPLPVVPIFPVCQTIPFLSKEKRKCF